MKRRFIISINGEITKENSNAFTNFLKENDMGWWHWLSNTWLVIDKNDEVDSKILRDKARDIFRAHNLVIEVKDGNWAGFGPKSKNKDMFDWIKRNWSNEKAEE